MVLAIWLFLFLVSAFGPMRWSLVAFLCLSTVDYEGTSGAFANFNLVKGVLLPIYLLWRLRAYSGHRLTVLAPVAWILLTIYVGIAGFWSLFPQATAKLVGQMTGSLLIMFVFVRATKGGYLTARTAIYTALGCVALAAIRTEFLPKWGDDPGRFTSFMSAQSFAALLVSLYCITLCGRNIRTELRALICSMLAVAILFDGSRIWFMGILLATFGALILAEGRAWIKICAAGAAIVVFAIMIGRGNTAFSFLAGGAASNRIASAITALHEGDTRSKGLGTYNFRHSINEMAFQQIKDSTASQLIFGRGTCNGAVITGSLFAGYSGYNDPNRMMHNEWLRVVYEWGIVGSVLWLLFIGSVATYALRGFFIDKGGDAKPLLIYLPAFCVALAGENMLAGAASAASTGFIFAVALATMPHRDFLSRKAVLDADRLARVKYGSPRVPRGLRSGWSGPQPSHRGV